MTDPLDQAWFALRDRLEAHSLELHNEVHTYPTPIARCDEQLTQAIEARDAAFRRLRVATELDGTRRVIARAEWIARLQTFVASLDEEDDRIAAARARLVDALARR
jgi:hypothetical protein